MLPTVGRIVIYRCNETDAEHGIGRVGQELPAIVTRVHNATCINLRVMTDSASVPPHMRSVCEGASPGGWTWPDRAPAATSPVVLTTR